MSSAASQPFTIANRMRWDPRQLYNGDIGMYKAEATYEIRNTGFRRFFDTACEAASLVKRTDNIGYGIIVCNAVPLGPVSLTGRTFDKDAPIVFCVITLEALAETFDADNLEACILDHNPEDIVQLIRTPEGIKYILTHTPDYNPKTTVSEDYNLAAVGLCTFLPHEVRKTLADPAVEAGKKKELTWIEPFETGFNVSGLSWLPSSDKKNPQLSRLPLIELPTLSGSTKLVHLSESLHDEVVENFKIERTRLLKEKRNQENPPPAYEETPLLGSARKTNETSCCVLL